METIWEQPKVKDTHKRLFLIPRAGWVKRGVINPESVGEHTEKLVLLAEEYKSELGISNVSHLKNLLKCHDWPEILCGDTLTYHLDGKSYEEAKIEKAKLEMVAMKNLCGELGGNGKRILDFWNEFEDKKTYEATIAHQLDKIQAVMQSFEYETSGETVSTMEFVDEVRKRKQIIHPFLVKTLSDIESQIKKLHVKRGVK